MPSSARVAAVVLCSSLAATYACGLAPPSKGTTGFGGSSSSTTASSSSGQGAGGRGSSSGAGASGTGGSPSTTSAGGSASGGAGPTSSSAGTGGTPLSGNGAPCSDGPTQCQSSFCVDGVCCDTPCTDACQTCSGGALGTGTCSAVAGSTDPGFCDGGNGSCAGGPPCVCSAGSCVQCVGDSDCGICQTCQSGVCTDVGQDAQTVGRCDDDNGSCGTQCACDGNGACKRKTGQSCKCGNECASNSCEGRTSCHQSYSHACDP